MKVLFFTSLLIIVPASTTCRQSPDPAWLSWELSKAERGIAESRKTLALGIMFTVLAAIYTPAVLLIPTDAPVSCLDAIPLFAMTGGIVAATNATLEGHNALQKANHQYKQLCQIYTRAQVQKLRKYPEYVQLKKCFRYAQKSQADFSQQKTIKLSV